MGRPLRLAVDEASALLVALRMLAEVAPGSRTVRRCRRLIAKLEAAAGEAASVSAQVAVQVDIPDHDAEGYAGADPRRPCRPGAGCTCATTSRAGTRRPSATSTRCGCSWWRGAPTWRAGACAPRGCGCSGWTGCSASTCSTCRPRRPPRPSRWTSTRACSGRRPTTALVELELSAAGRWVAEYYPCEAVTDLEDGRLRVTLRTPDTRLGAAAGAAARRGRPGRLAVIPGVRGA